MDNCFWCNRSSNNSISLLNRVIYGTCVILYLINETFLKRTGISVIFKNHFNDFLGIILLFSFINMLIGYYNKAIIYRYPYILIFTLIVGMFWEYITPLYNKKSTSDIWDIVAYLIGATVYYLISRLWRRHHIRRIIKYVEI